MVANVGDPDYALELSTAVPSVGLVCRTILIYFLIIMSFFYHYWFSALIFCLEAGELRGKERIGGQASFFS